MPKMVQMRHVQLVQADDAAEELHELCIVSSGRCAVSFASLTTSMKWIPRFTTLTLDWVDTANFIVVFCDCCKNALLEGLSIYLRVKVFTLASGLRRVGLKSGQS